MEVVKGAENFPEPYMGKAIMRVAKKEKIIPTEMIVTACDEIGVNFSGDIFKVKLKGKRDGNDIVLNLMLKSTKFRQPINGEESIYNDYYRKEIDIYTNLFPRLRTLEEDNDVPSEEWFEHPVFYHGEIESLKEFFIMEDLSDLGFRNIKDKKCFDFQHIALVVRALAKFHALAFALRELNFRTFQTMAKSYVEMEATEKFRLYILSTTRKASEFLNDEHAKQKFSVFSESILKKFKKYSNPELTDPYNTFCHGDCWFNNFMFRYENKVPVDIRVVDWQMVKTAPPVRDLSHLLFLCTDDEFRHNHYEETLDLYYEELKKYLKFYGLDVNIVYPVAVYREHLKMLSSLGLLAALNAMPFVLSENGEIPDIREILANTVSDENITFSALAKKRIRGAIMDCIRLNII